ncbi:YiiX/YebB-like N1pC/P60 family cysteine hydrolase [Vogesella oryzae]|uniref:YiiX/YebB-like N1pC/P60 family cysteine hydrolase n=1 Tax=Vogesella oryzae TaxID=1735285 RepID=UPI001581E247|nr:YiiX/YebB-like N1pC/P60 family cysteine hydrolase [Vogesella oryzae]
MLDQILHAIGRALARYLSKPLKSYAPVATIPPEKLAAILQPGDVLLVEGHSRLSMAIKYLTQSTWSHAAFYVGNHAPGSDGPMLIEADVQTGVRLVPLATYAHLHTRVCRPEKLQPGDLERIIGDALQRVGQSYDLRNIVDLARYLLPAPPVPTRWRRRMIALGAGDPTKAICSTLIAQLFASIHYPILPEIRHIAVDHPGRAACYREILHIRNYRLFTPRDFDISPYFQIIKPERPTDFDYRTLDWDD